MKYFFLFFFLFFAFSFTHAQSKYVISGKVIQEGDDTPLEFVNVIAFKEKDSSFVLAVISDGTGQFKLDDLSSGDYFVRFKFIGFADKVISHVSLTGSTKKVDLGQIELSLSNTLGEVVVKSEEKLIENTVDKRIYNVDQDLTSKGGSLTDVLNNVPSVDVDQDGNVSLRGNSGVNILIDGRQSVSTKSTLETIPASSIERIEIINNPSAKYNPEGMAGIINIVLKKNTLRGINGNVDLSYATGNQYSVATGINYRNKNVNFFTNYNYRVSQGFNTANRMRTRLVNDENELLDQTSSGNRGRGGHTAKIGADFTLKTNHVLGVSVSGMFRDKSGTGIVNNSLSYNDILSSYNERSNDETEESNNMDANLNYRWRFQKDKGDLTFDFTESIGNEKELGLYKQTYFDQNYIVNNTPLLRQNQINPSKFSIFSGQMDLTRNFKHNIRFETGAKAMINEDRNTQYRETYNDSLDAFMPDLNINNDFKLNQQTYAVYGIVGHEIKKFKYQVGLRLEQTFMNPVLLTTNQSYKNDYLSLFPSAHVSYELSKKGVINLSYSRRINRPSGYELNPFPSYTDPYNLRKGNPALKPEYINSIELGYNKDWKKLSLIAIGYFRQSLNVIQRVVQYYPDGTGASTYANINQRYNFGVEAIVVYSPFDWWKNTLSSNFFQTKYQDSDKNLVSNSSGFSGSVKLMTSFSLWKKTTTIQVNGNYNLPMISPQGKMLPRASADITLQRTLLKGNLTLGLRVSDIFNTRSFYMDLTSGGVHQISNFKWQTRRLYLTLSYRFGKLKESKDSKNRGGGQPGDGGDMDF